MDERPGSGANSGKFNRDEREKSRSSWLSNSGRVIKPSETSISRPEDIEESYQSALDFEIGDTIGGTYCILSHLGRGGMGHVYGVEHVMLRQTYALKILHADSATGTSWKRFQNEARTIAKLDHPNIIKVHNLGVHNEKVPYYVMDLLEGETLSSLIRRMGRLSEKDTLDLFIPLCDGLGYAHAHGVVHRDIKPSNIMLIVQNEKVIPKLVDFGLVKLVGNALSPSQQLTASGEVFGSPLYMSPEQSIGRHINERTDIYSLGCTLFQALSGSPPFVGENVVQTVMKHQNEPAPTLKEASMGLDFSPEWEAVCARALAKEADNRYQTMDEFAADLMAIRAGKKLNVASATAGGDLFGDAPANTAIAKQRDTKKRFTMVGLIGAAVLLVVGSAGTYFMLQAQKKSEITSRPIDSMQGGVHEGDKASTETAATAPVTPATMALDPDFEDTSKKFVQNGGKLENNERVFLFPKQEIGNLQTHFGDPQKDKNYAVMGEVKIPFAPEFPLLQFDANELVGAHPKVLRRFEPTDLQAVHFLDKVTDTDDVLRFLDHMTLIGVLNIEGCDVTAKGLETVGSFDKLQTLYLGRTKNLTAEDVAKLKNLGNLVSLDFRGHKNITPLLEKLTTSKKLLELKLSDSAISEQDMALISKISGLKKIELVNCKINDKKVAYLKKIPDLYQIKLAQNNISSDFIDMFKDNTTIHYIEISTTGWKDSDRDLLKKTFQGRIKLKDDEMEDVMQ